MNFRMARQTCFGMALALAALAGCARSFDADKFIAQVDQSPPEKRPPNWEHTKKLMARRPPAVGELAPDFSLPTLDGSATVHRTTYQRSRPLVLVFGSFT